MLTVTGGDLLVQALGGVRQQVPVLVHRAALDRHAVPHGGDGLVEARRSVDDEELGPLQPARTRSSSTLRQASALSPPMLLIASGDPRQAVKMVLLPKFLGNVQSDRPRHRIADLFDRAHEGAEQAAKELQNPTPLQFLGPTSENSVAGQIEIVTNANRQGVNAIMISDNSGDQIVPAVKAAHDKRIKVVTWHSPIPSAEGEDVFVEQVDVSQTGQVMADMALNTLGADGGEFAILSVNPDPAR
jgi:rhamnose transport system substrate-binding protein